MPITIKQLRDLIDCLSEEELNYYVTIKEEPIELVHGHFLQASYAEQARMDMFNGKEVLMLDVRDDKSGCGVIGCDLVGDDDDR